MDSILEKERKRVRQERIQLEQERLKEQREFVQKNGFKNLTNESTSAELIRASYDLIRIGASAYSKVVSNYKFLFKTEIDYETFSEKMEEYDKGGMLKNIHLFVEYVEGIIDYAEFINQIWKVSKTKEEAKKEQMEKELREREIKEKTDVFYSTYPNFKKNGYNL